MLNEFLNDMHLFSFFRFLTIVYQNITLCELGGAKMYIEIKWFSSLVFDHKKRVKIEQKNDYTTTFIVISEKRSKKEKLSFYFFKKISMVRDQYIMYACCVNFCKFLMRFCGS